MATFVVDELEMEGLVAADAAAVSQDEVAEQSLNLGAAADLEGWDLLPPL